MKVLIVAKTRMGSGACIGAIAFEGRSLRLLAAGGDPEGRANLAYQVGEVWEIDGAPAPEIIPPHVENLLVRSRNRLGTMMSPLTFIERHMPPLAGEPGVLYQGLTQATATGALYIAWRTGIPAFSTLFWKPDRPLQLDTGGKRIRYRYDTPEGGVTLTFVGFQEPVELIPAGTVVRVSLAHWWCSPELPDGEERCFVQLSGWFHGEENCAKAPVASRAGRSRGHSRREGGPTREAMAVSPSRDSSPLESDAGHDQPALEEARRLLQDVFGFDQFWPMQADVIDNLLRGRDTLVVMPTGGGKSLCYQLPALLWQNLTLVVSPLIALMQDQVDQLRELGIDAAFLNSSLDYSTYLATAARVRQGQVRLLYVAPETLLRPETLLLLEQRGVDCLVIDEAHCISSWGHDFRPDYRRLLPLRSRFPGAVCVALTATATPRVQADIRQTLGFGAANQFVASFDRPNLRLAVQPRIDGLRQTLDFLEAHRDQSGIIYCSTRRQVETLVDQLTAQGWPVLPYHAGLDDAVRRRHQHQFVRDQVPIMVATIAFGMGINKSNVRFILHYNLPKSIESYYQQIGRAGRDGLPADCLLLFSSRDVGTIYHFIDKGAESEQRGRQARLQALVRLAQSGRCRRAQLLAYFGEKRPGGSCQMCDNCLAGEDGRERVDVSEAARAFLACVQQTGQRFGLVHVIKILRGSQAQAVVRRDHHRLPAHGSGLAYSNKQWRHLVQQFIEQDLLEQDMQHGGLRLGPQAAAVLQGATVTAILDLSWTTQGSDGGPASDYDAVLFQELRVLRRQLADAADVPAYVVFSDRTLVQMAASYPQTVQQLLAIDGVGQLKLERYGDRVLHLIRSYCQAHGIEAARPARRPTPPVLEGKRRFQEVGERFAAGWSIQQLQESYDVRRSTVVDHLYRYLQSGQPVQTERVLAASGLTGEMQARVLAALAELGTERLRPIYDALDGEVPFEELHILRLAYASARQDAN